MKIVVTGGAGHIGRAAVAQLLSHGHEVRVLDRVPQSEMDPSTLGEIEGAAYRQVDIADIETLRPAFEGMEAAVHLAALVHPGAGPDHVIFDINGRGTFNVYRAAADAGITRVVSASSINALGFNYGVKAFQIRYFPIDEEHEAFTTDGYSFSKRIGEEIADYFWRREGVSGTSLRFPGVYRMSPEREERMHERMIRRREAFEALEAMSPAERRRRINSVLDRYADMRAKRIREQPHDVQRRYWEKLRGEGPIPPEATICWGYTNFWASMHVLDAAQAIEKSLIADYDGSHTLFVNDSHNSAGVSSRHLVNYCFPEVTAWTRPVRGTETLVSIDKARELIGFEPAYSISRFFPSAEPVSADTPEPMLSPAD
jgi:nucleoside-diphosphate-sugar epimerase